MNALPAVGLAASLLIAVVFAVAGVAKLGDQAGARTAVREFGVPASLANLFALVLPIVELAVAVLLVNSSTRVTAQSERLASSRFSQPRSRSSSPAVVPRNASAARLGKSR